ncbi:alkaline phosphatase-like [Calliphora vicina]|uniref:alkaline phosphatase-like n=1 Tax=Calliphora vicina TaxID=7373 RepID=UPI00325B6784
MFLNFLLLAISFAFVLAITDQDIHLRSYSDGNNRMMGNIATGKYTPAEEKDPEFWRSLAQRELAKRLGSVPNYNRAKNIIFFLGDGMSISTVTASRIRKGQLKGKTGEEDALSFEKFPWTGLSKTYCSNSQVADSACTSTAYLCGVKANIMTIGVSANVEYNNCSMSMDPKNHVSSLADWAQKAGKSTGFVTTTTLTHASPSGMYAHTANRYWESDADVLAAQQDPATCMDMAQQLITQSPGRNLDVMMGGGMGKFIPNKIKDAHGKKGERKDGQNLLTLWKKLNPKGALVTNRKQLLNLNVNKVDKIIGTFGSTVMDFHAHADNTKQPRLVEMTEVALKFLKQKNNNGYVIFIEGGLIDYGNHFNKPGLSTDETLEFEKAIELAVNITDPNETLIVVTSDHAHPLSIAGYPGRGTPILGVNQHDVDSNGRKYATLNYAVGPEQYLDGEGKSLDLEGLIEGIDSTHPSQIPGSIGVHGGDDVGIFALGPFSHLFSGVLQQNSIPHLMAFAAGIGV